MGVVLLLILGGEVVAETLLEVLEEVGFLAFEWAEKTLDLLFEELLDLTPEAAQKTTAWFGLLMIMGLVGWLCYWLYRQYGRFKAGFSHWREAKIAELEAWWGELPWLEKLFHVLFGFALLGILVLFI